MRTYLIVGIYADDHSRFAQSYAAANAELAELMATNDHENLIVAATLNEEGQLVD
jgi:hypothetical protein